MYLILYLIESLVYYLIKSLLILITLLVAVYYGFVFIRKLLFKGVISSDGKAVLITGCDSGFGNRLAQRLSRMGFRVYATVLSTASPGAEELKSNPLFANKVIVLQMNITNDCEVNEVYEKVKNDLQRSGHMLWAVVNNAGIFQYSPLEWGKLDTFRQVFEVNVFGTVRVTRVFLPLIRTSRGMTNKKYYSVLASFSHPGRITNVASIAGRVPYSVVGIYSMSKFSVVAFSETLRRELHKFNVNVSSIEPGQVRTAFTDIQGLIKFLENNWSQSSNEVKKSYASLESEIKTLKNKSDWYPMKENIDVIVDDMIDSIVNRWPKPVYGARGIFYNVLLTFNMFLPSFVLDWMFRVIDSFIG